MTLKLTQKRKNILNRLHLKTPLDVLNYFPRRYQDLTGIDLGVGNNEQKVFINAKVIDVSKLARFGVNRTRFTIFLDHNDEEIKGIVFNREYMYRTLEPNVEVIVGGKFDFYKREIIVSDLFLAKNYENKNKLKGIYPLIEDVANKEIVSLIAFVYNYMEENGLLNEVLPEVLTKKYRLISRKEAYQQIHNPESNEKLKEAYRYLKFEELIIFNLSMIKSKKANIIQGESYAKKIDNISVNHLLDSLPYKLSEDQLKVLKEIFADLRSNHTMYRLLQGDVGTGKTLVALISLIGVCFNQVQGALMAPTDILSRQHFQNFQKLLSSIPTRVALLVSSMPLSERKETIKKIALGEIDIVIGTVALIQEKVNFKNLGLVVIDEQHRFGVNQRRSLRQKGDGVDVLMMSATPIPRTLALALYGDMDISTLYHYPLGKRKVITKVIKSNSIVSILDEVEQVLSLSRKVYVITPLIENDESTLKTATKVYDALKLYFKDKYQVGLLHGKMQDDEKEGVINQFTHQNLNLLVATTVVEVGVDVKSADMIIIYDADRFGLAQLHQLRGRVGRGGQEAKCYLFTSATDEDTIKRLRFLEQSDDGFEISNFDLQNRGPGELSGIKQSGELDFNLVNIVDDIKIFEVAKEEASKIYDDVENGVYPDLKNLLGQYLAKHMEVIE